MELCWNLWQKTTFMLEHMSLVTVSTKPSCPCTASRELLAERPAFALVHSSIATVTLKTINPSPRLSLFEDPHPTPITSLPLLLTLRHSGLLLVARCLGSWQSKLSKRCFHSFPDSPIRAQQVNTWNNTPTPLLSPWDTVITIMSVL